MCSISRSSSVDDLESKSRPGTAKTKASTSKVFDNSSYRNSNAALNSRGRDQSLELSRRFSQTDYENLIRDEFLKLNRRYRQMENIRSVVLSHGGKSIKKSSRQIDFLECEKASLESELVIAESLQNQLKDQQAKEEIIKILQDYECFVRDIKTCWQIISETESSVDKISKRLLEQQLKTQALFGSCQSISQIEKKRETLENKLYHYKTQFDTYIQKNKELRNEIDLMLNTRGDFFSRYIYVKQKINQEKNKMGDIVYKSIHAYDQRDDSIAKIRSLRDRNDKESQQHVLEIKEFNRVLHHDQKLLLFMETKNKLRLMLENAAQRNIRKFVEKIQEIDNQLKNYIQGFRKILHLANFSKDINVLIQEFALRESRNFAYFKQLTELNSEICSIFEAIKYLVGEIGVLHSENKSLRKGRKEILYEYNDDYELERKNLEDTLERWLKAENEMNEFIEELDKVFNAAECDKAPIIRLLGNLNGIGPRNAELCMTLLEHRVDHLIYERESLQLRKSIELDDGSFPKRRGVRYCCGRNPKALGGHIEPTLMITGRLDLDDDEEEEKLFEKTPIPYNEMRVSLLEKLKVIQSQEKQKLKRKSTITEDDDNDGTSQVSQPHDNNNK